MFQCRRHSTARYQNLQGEGQVRFGDVGPPQPGDLLAFDQLKEAVSRAGLPVGYQGMAAEAAHGLRLLSAREEMMSD